MTPVQISLLLGLITQAIASAPQIATAIKSSVDFIGMLFSAKLITKEQQDALMAFVNANQQLALAGIRPQAWTVEADPSP